MSKGNGLFRSRELARGYSLHLHRTRAFKTVTARLVLRADLDEGTAARALVPRVLARGTRRLPTLRELQTELDQLYGASLGGDVGKVGECHVVQIRADWVNDGIVGEPLADRMAALMAEYLHEPAGEDGEPLRTAMVEQERKMLADEATAIFDDKARYARRRLLETMCRGEPYARPPLGTPDEIAALDVDGVRAAYSRLVKRAPADLFLVGDLTWTRAARFARVLRLHRRPPPYRVRATVRRRPSRPRTVRERQAVGQARLELGFRTPIKVDGPRYPGLVMMNALFGGTPMGRLFRKVREEASLCYSVHSVVERTKGLVLVDAGIDAAQAGRARRLILAQLRELAAGRVSDAELAPARGIVTSALRALRDAPGGMIDFGLERAVHGRSADLDGLLARLGAVTAADVARAARTLALDTVFLLTGEREA